jgi:hypothetical protein
VHRNRLRHQPRTQPVEAVNGEGGRRHAERRHDRRVPDADGEPGTTEANLGTDCRAQADGDGSPTLTQADSYSDNTRAEAGPDGGRRRA